MSMQDTVRRGFASLTASYLILMFCVFPSAIAGAGAAQANPNVARAGSQEIGARVSGHVFRADTGAPLAGAVVTLNPSYVIGIMWFEKTTTGADGSYTVAAAPFSYTATASSPGFVPQNYGRGISPWAKELNLSSGQKVENIDFHLAVAAVVSGSVSDGKGQPVAHIRVSAVHRQFWPGGESHLRTVQLEMTDDQGNFHLDALPPGDFFVCADAAHETVGATGPVPGWTYRRICYPSAPSVENAQQVRASAGKETAGIRFQMTADKTYTIFAEAQDPAAGNVRRSYFPSLQPSGMSTSGAVGNMATIPQVFPGTYTLTLAAFETFENGVRELVGKGSQSLQVVDSDVHIVVPIVPIGKPGEVSGRVVVEPSGAASLSGMQLGLRSSEGWAQSSIDASGSFDFHQVVPGQQLFALLGKSKNVYLKHAYCSGQDFTTKPLTIQAGQIVSDCKVALAADTGLVSGSVSKGNHPAAGMVVVLIPQSLALRALREIRAYTLTATTDAVGHFQIERVIPADYFLFAVTPDIDAPYYALDFSDRNQRHAQSVSVKPNETRVVSLKLTAPR